MLRIDIVEKGDKLEVNRHSLLLIEVGAAWRDSIPVGARRFSKSS